MPHDMTSMMVRPTRAWDMSSIRDGVASADLGGAMCGRIVGYWVGEDDDGRFGTAWMCNAADAERFDVAFPVTISVRWDGQGRVTSIELDERFEGSQGITCARSFIERRTRGSMLGTPLRVREPVISDPMSFGCRHVFELVYGLAGFKGYLDDLHLVSGEFHEATADVRTESGLLMCDEIECRGTTSRLDLGFDLDVGDIRFDNQGVLQSTGEIRIGVPTVMVDSEYIHSGVPAATFSGEANAQITSSAVRALTPAWRCVSEIHGNKRGLVFSTLWPPSAYSVFVQGIAQTLFRNNFTYFQHCIGGLQRTTGQPKCVGVIQSLEEAAPIFPELRREDFI